MTAQQLSILDPTPTPAEEWRPVADAPGYTVSNHGKVRGLRGKEIGSLNNGYPRVILATREEGPRHEYVHRLVAMTFIGPPPTNDHEVNHIDANRQNNHVGNLEWVTHQENIRHAAEMGRYCTEPTVFGEGHGMSVLTDAQVLAIYRRYAEGGVPQYELAAEYGVAQFTVQRIVAGDGWKHLTDGKHARPHPLRTLDYDEIVRLDGEGWTTRQIADHFDCSLGGVRRALKVMEAA